MMPSHKIAAIVNPHSGGGKTGKRWPQMARQLEDRLGRIEARFTERQGHATSLTRELLDQGFDLIIGIGGDGTFNEIANGFIKADQQVRPEACMAIIPAGTGGDFRRMFGHFSGNEISKAIEILISGRPVAIDVGKVSFLTPQIEPSVRYFINLVSFGMGGAVAARSRNFLTPFSGRLAFLWATFCVLLSYRGKEITLMVDDNGAASSFFVTNIAVGNGCFHGGGMNPCPTAVLDDGILEVTVIEYMSMIRLLRDIRALYSGNIYTHPKVRHLRGVRIEAVANSPTWIEVDGEPLGKLPLEITVLPQKLPILVPSTYTP